MVQYTLSQISSGISISGDLSLVHRGISAHGGRTHGFFCLFAGGWGFNGSAPSTPSVESSGRQLSHHPAQSKTVENREPEPRPESTPIIKIPKRKSLVPSRPIGQAKNKIKVKRESF